MIISLIRIIKIQLLFLNSNNNPMYNLPKIAKTKFSQTLDEICFLSLSTHLPPLMFEMSSHIGLMPEKRKQDRKEIINKLNLKKNDFKTYKLLHCDSGKDLILKKKL